MKYIISSLSIGGMLKNPPYDLIIKEINQETFQMLACDAESHIGQEDIAILTNQVYNKTPIHPRNDDVLLLVQKYGKTLKFYCIRVVELPTPVYMGELYEEVII